MTSPEEIWDLVPAVALGSADARDIRRVERLAARDPILADELRAMRAAVDELAIAVPQREAPDHLRRRLMATVRAEARTGREPLPPPAAAPIATAIERLRSWRPHAGTIAAVASLVAVMLVWQVVLRVDPGADRGDVVTSAVAGTPVAPGVRGQVIHVPEEGAAVLRLSNLPELAAGEGYELWTLRDGRATSAGFLTAGPAGSAMGAATDLVDVDALAVTVEQTTNRGTPTGVPLVRIPLGRA
jgi:hypothetical protein